jgi:enoyl-CoA hydratase
MLQNPGNYGSIVNLIREGLVNAHGIVNCDKPIVSAINGEAMGSGLAVGLLADISVASTNARLVDGHLLQGIAAGDHSRNDLALSAQVGNRPPNFAEPLPW